MHNACFSVIANSLELELLLLPPSGRLRYALQNDTAVGLREFVGIGRACARRAAAPAVEVVEKQLSFDGHVQLPERVPTAPPEETLQRKDSTPTDAKGLHGGALGMHGTCAVRVCTRKDLRVEMRIRDLCC